MDRYLVAIEWENARQIVRELGRVGRVPTRQDLDRVWHAEEDYEEATSEAQPVDQEHAIWSLD